MQANASEFQCTGTTCMFASADKVLDNIVLVLHIYDWNRFKIRILCVKLGVDVDQPLSFKDISQKKLEENRHLELNAPSRLSNFS